jgi:transcriptional/translational regulatory protein YebC/TACO1
MYEITCDPAAYEPLRKALQAKEIPIEVSEISMVPQTTIPINNVETARKIISLMEAIEDHDDVQNTYANFDIPDAIMEKVS